MSYRPQTPNVKKLKSKTETIPYTLEEKANKYKVHSDFNLSIPLVVAITLPSSEEY